jgi:hypothetical protein
MESPVGTGLRRLGGQNFCFNKFWPHGRLRQILGNKVVDSCDHFSHKRFA